MAGREKKDPEKAKAGRPESLIAKIERFTRDVFRETEEKSDEFDRKYREAADRIRRGPRRTAGKAP